jgi:hypothetical protein
MHRLIKPFGVLVLAACAVSCGDVVRSSSSPVILSINSLQASAGATPGTFTSFLQSDVQNFVTSGTGAGGQQCTNANPCPTIFNDSGQVIFSIVLKNIGTTANPATPTTNNDVTINRYHVEYIRADGHNVPGVDVPYGFDGAVTATVTGTGSVTVGFELVRHDAKMEPPLAQLAVNGSIITTIATVTFYGQDRTGNAISASGTIQVDFGNFAG